MSSTVLKTIAQHRLRNPLMASSCQPATDQAAEDSKTNENSAPLQLRQPLAQLLPVEVSVSTFSIPLSLSLCLSLSHTAFSSGHSYLKQGAPFKAKHFLHTRLALDSLSLVTWQQNVNCAEKLYYDCNVSHANGMMTAAAWNSSSGTAWKSTTFGSGSRRAVGIYVRGNGR